MNCAVVFGANGGIGGALVAHLAASGRFARVYAGSRGPAVPPAGALPFTYDLTDEASLASAVANMEGMPEMVVVASGLLHDPTRAITPEKSLRHIDAKTMAHLFAINTIGPALIAKHMLPRLPRHRRAVFGVLSARVGSIGDNRLGGWHSYRASKAALNMLVANFAIEMRRTHPQAIVAALHPGTVATSLSGPFRSAVAPDRLFSPDVSASHLLRLIEGLGPDDSGNLFAWNGERLPW